MIDAYDWWWCNLRCWKVKICNLVFWTCACDDWGGKNMDSTLIKLVKSHTGVTLGGADWTAKR